MHRLHFSYVDQILAEMKLLKKIYVYFYLQLYVKFHWTLYEKFNSKKN